MALRALVKTSKDSTARSSKTSAKILYRTVIKELPRVLAIYDIDMPLEEAVNGVRYQFRKHGKIEDPRVFSILMAKGYMDLEETLMQWKNKIHLLKLIQPAELTIKPLTEEEKWKMNIDDDDEDFSRF